MTRHFLSFLASSVNPVLLVVFAACVVAKLPTRNSAVAFFARSGAALLVTYLIAHLNRWMHLWKNHGSFPSGHMTFYLAVATSFFLLDRRSALYTVPLAFFYGWLVVFLDFHTWTDVWGSLLFAIPLTLFCHWKKLRVQ